MGFLEHARAVGRVSIEGTHLTLFVHTTEAKEFFESEVNKSRLEIVSRSICALEQITVLDFEEEEEEEETPEE